MRTTLLSILGFCLYIHVAAQQENKTIQNWIHAFFKTQKVSSYRDFKNDDTDENTTYKVYYYGSKGNLRIQKAIEDEKRYLTFYYQEGKLAMVEEFMRAFDYSSYYFFSGDEYIGSQLSPKDARGKKMDTDKLIKYSKRYYTWLEEDDKTRVETQQMAHGLWLTNKDEAIAKAKDEGKLILIDFTGSDWCGPCMKLKKETFDTQAFQDYAKEHLVLLEIDSPRRKQLPPELTQQNSLLKSQFGIRGFPSVFLVNYKMHKSTRYIEDVGYKGLSVQEYIERLDEEVKNYKAPKR